MHRWPYELPTDHYDVGVVVSFGKMIPAASIDRCKFGMLNVHGSLLPAFRGAAPIHRAILSGCRETGVTIMRLAARRFDVGEILLQQPIELSETSRTSQVYPQMARLGAQLLLQCLQDLPFYLSRARSQNDQEASYAPKVKDHEAAIDWSNMNSSLIYRMFRAFDLFVHLHCHWIDGSRLSLYQMATPEQTRALQIDSVLARFAPALVPHLQPGLLYYHKPQKLICVRCADHKWVAFGSVCLKNFKTMNALQFHNGFISKVSAKNTLPVILK